MDSQNRILQFLMNVVIPRANRHGSVRTLYIAGIAWTSPGQLVHTRLTQPILNKSFENETLPTDDQCLFGSCRREAS